MLVSDPEVLESGSHVEGDLLGVLEKLSQLGRSWLKFNFAEEFLTLSLLSYYPFGGLYVEIRLN